MRRAKLELGRFGWWHTVVAMTTTESDPDDVAEDGATVAMVLRQLTWLPPGTAAVHPTLERASIQRTAINWQELGAHAQWAELHGATKGAVEGRMSELMGRAAVGGEQLGLAWTLDQELQRWDIIGAAGHSGRSMATRALAEMCGYYLLAAAHGLGNLTVRTLMLSRPAAAVLNIKLSSAKGFPPFSEDRAAWPPLNSKMASAAKYAALASGEGAAVDLAQVILDLLAAPRWIALVNRRDTDFHRWRPQGLPTGGVPQRSLWDRPQPGTRILSGGASFYDPVDHEELCRIAGDALDELGEAMKKWLDMWSAVLAALGVGVFKVGGP